MSLLKIKSIFLLARRASVLVAVVCAVAALFLLDPFGTDPLLADLDQPVSVEQAVPLSLTPIAEPPLGQGSGGKTLVLVNQWQLLREYGAGEVVPLLAKLDRFVSHPAVDGTIEFVDSDPTFTRVWDLWQADPANVSLANAVSSAVHDITTRWQSRAQGLGDGAQHVVIVGGDSQIPYRRIDANMELSTTIYENVPLGSALGTSYLAEQILTDDFYGDLQGLVKGQPFEPTLGTGRLVETPSEMMAVLNQFLNTDGQITLGSALTAGFGPMVDAAEGACALFVWDELEADCELIGETWLPDQLDAKLVEEVPNLLMLYMQTDHSFISVPNANDNQALLADRLSAWSMPDSGTIAYFPVSNYAGLNVPVDGTPPTDWAQMWLAHGAAFIGNTHRGFVTSEAVDYSELLGQHFLETVVAPESIELGQAMNQAKANYRSEITLREGGFFGEVHQLINAQTVLYGLPMTKIVSPFGDAFEKMGDSRCEQAPAVTMGEVGQHSFHVAGDVDWLKFSAVAGDSILVSLAEQGDAFAESLIFQGCGANAVQIARVENSLLWEVAATGDYYIQTRSTLPGIHGPGIGYTLSINLVDNLFLPYLSN